MSESKSFSADDTQCVDNIRCLSADVVQGANSGHPGAPMGMAPMAHVLFKNHLRFSSSNSSWMNRDRFVLSNGHACALLYSMLHLSGYKVTLDDLKNFRQLGSNTPGHPEAHDTDGVEVTTGPLGQGIANAVGMAIAEAHLGAVYNKPEHTLFDNFVYVFCGDGCLQEGVSAEAASLAGHLGLGKLIVLYDDNDITIDGSTSLSFSEDVLKRFEAYGWHTSRVEKGDTDLAGIDAAIAAAKCVSDKPSIISIKTTIGLGAKKQGTAGVHGSPLGDADIANVKAAYGFPADKKYHIAEVTAQSYAASKARGAALEAEWNATFASYEAKYPTEAAELKRRIAGELPSDWQKALPAYVAGGKKEATRSSSGKVITALSPLMPELMGGSADLTPSNKTQIPDTNDFQKATPDGRYIRFGVREHAMTAIANGLVAYGAIVPFTATFLNFIEYCFPAIRLSALSHLQTIFVATHDSIGLGEDGPTHQPIEALSLCRATPNLLTFRPADGNETAGAYAQALLFKSGPSVLALSRQDLPQLAGSSVEAVAKGGYVLQDSKDPAEVIIIATGSEVEIALAAAAKLSPKNVRVVSMPCTELFDQQDAAYRRSVIIPGVPTISVEVLSATGWEKYAHHSIAMTTYGRSAPAEQVYDLFGFTDVKVAATVTQFIADATALAAEVNAPAFGLLQTHLH